MFKDINSLEARELEVVLKISQAVSRTLDLKEILKMACRMTARALNADRCSIGLLDTKGTYTISHSSYRKRVSYPSIAGEKFIASHYPVIARKLLERKVIQIIRDKPSSFLSINERRLLKQLNMKVFLAVPIVVGGKPIGAFHLARVEKTLPFSFSDINLCQTIASQIGIAIKNATLVEELRKGHELLEKQSEDLKTRYQQQNLILNISRSLFQTANLQEVFNIITQKTCEALKLDRCTILQFDSEQKEAVIRSVYHTSGGPRGKGTHDSANLGKKFLAESSPQIYGLLRKQGFLLTEDFKSNPLLPGTRRYIKDLGVKSALTIPFYYVKKISGCLQLSTLKDHHHFSDSEIKFCQTIANLVSLALENVKLVSNLQEKSITLQHQAEALGKQYREQNILLEISRAVSQTLDLQELFDIATETTARLLRVERSTILFYDESSGIATYKSAFIKGRHDRDYMGRELKVSQYPTLKKLLEKSLTLSVPDITESPYDTRDRKYFKEKGVKSLLAAPFSLATGMVGVFSVGTHDRRVKFSDSEVRLCKSIANLLSVAIANAMLMQNLQEKGLTIQQQADTLKKQFREQSILLDISKALSQTLDLKGLFGIVARKSVELLRVDRCTTMLFDQSCDSTIIYKVFAEGRYQPEYEGLLRTRQDYPILSSHLLKKPHLFCAYDLSRSDLSPKEKKLLEKERIKSLLVIPFYFAKTNLGLMALSTLRRLHKFTEHEISLGQAIANQLSMAVENARLIQDLCERNVRIQEQSEALSKQFREQTILLDISKALSQTLDLKRLFEIVTKKTTELLGIDHCAAMIIDAPVGDVVLYTAYSNGKYLAEYNDMCWNLKDFPVLVSRLKNKRIFYTSDISKSVLSQGEKRVCAKMGLKSLLNIPFILKGRIMGIFALNTTKEPHEFSESEIRLSQAIANQLSVAVENASLIQDLQEKSSKIREQGTALEKQLSDQAILLEVSQALSQTLDMKELFKIVTRKTVELLGVDRAAAMIIDPATGNYPLFTHFSRVKQPAELKIFPKSIRDFPYIIDQVRNGQIFCVSDIAKSSLTSKEKSYFRKRGIKSVLSIPFILGGQLLGILGLNSIGKQHEFTQPEINLCQAIANQLSVAVENARLMQDLREERIKIEKQSEALQKQFKEQTILLEISKALSQTLNLKKLFDIVTRKAVEAIGVDRAVAMIIDQQTGGHPLFVHYCKVKRTPELDLPPASVRDFSYSVSQLRTARVCCIPEVARSPLSAREKEYFSERNIKSVLSIPFILKGKLLGILALNSIARKHEFTESEIKLCQAIGNQLAMAVENANLMEVSKKHSEELEKLSLQIITAQEEERKNIAGKLHDVVGQDLAALQLDLKMSRQELPEQCTQIRNRLEEGEGLARQALENVRNLTMDLRPPILDDFGLSSAIRWYVDGFSRRTNIKVTLKLQELDCKFLPEFETAIYRTIQECLTNVAKHSEASRVNVSLDKKTEHLRIVIQDNGIGFNPEIFHFTSGFGLFRLKEKTELLGGKFRLSSKRGKGTRVVIIFPCMGKEKK